MLLNKAYTREKAKEVVEKRRKENLKNLLAVGAVGVATAAVGGCVYLGHESIKNDNNMSLEFSKGDASIKFKTEKSKWTN